MANALRPSNPLKNKSNIHAVGNRYQEATAEDFQELGQILDDHATKIDAVTGAPDQNPNYGVYTSLSLLSATHPTAVAGAYAVIDPGTGSDPQIALWDDTDDEWVLQVNYPTNAISTDVGQSLIYGSDNKPYFHETILFKGTYIDLVALQTAHPTADVGSYAYVDAGIGEDVQAYIWDDDDDGWVLQGSASGPAMWGGITGTLSDQTDLQSVLDTKVDLITDQNIDGNKTFIKQINTNIPVTVTAAKNEKVRVISGPLGNIFCVVKTYWNGSAFVSAGDGGIGVGIAALANAISKNPAVFGTYGGTNLIGHNPAGLGQNVLFNWVGDDVAVVGFNAAYEGSGKELAIIGSFAANKSVGDGGVFGGYLTGGLNSGSYPVLLGHNAGRINRGWYVFGGGPSALIYNKGYNNSGIGRLVMARAISKDNSGIGEEVLQYAEGDGNNVIGSKSFNTFITDAATKKTFAPGDVTVGTSRVTVTSHGFGPNGAFVNLKYETTGTPLGGGIVANSINSWLIVDTNTLSPADTAITSQGTGTHSLTAQTKYAGVNILGNNLQPTRSNQSIIGGLSAVMPNSTIAEIDNIGAKAIVSKEYADTKYASSFKGFQVSSSLTTSQSLTAGANNKAEQLTVIDINPNGWYDTTNKWFKPTIAGIYEIGGLIVVQNVPDNAKLSTSIVKNGTDYTILGRGTIAAATVEISGFGGSCFVEMNGTTDYVEMSVYCSASGTSTVKSTSSVKYSYFWGKLL